MFDLSKSKGFHPYHKFLKNSEVSKVTGWRWRRNGWIKTFNISGKLYVSEEEVNRFTARASAGEFSQKPVGAAAESSAAAEIEADAQGEISR